MITNKEKLTKKRYTILNKIIKGRGIYVKLHKIKTSKNLDFWHNLRYNYEKML